jgi:phenylpyruvate tautomerase PptA (4-oxalocrotonate tautomerase family)
VALAAIEVLAGLSADERRALVAGVRSALSEALRVPKEDPVVRLIEHEADNFARPFPERHSERFTLVVVTMFRGRSMDTKRRLYEGIVRNLGLSGVPACDISIVIHEPPMDNWGIAGGKPASEVDVGFEVDV